MSQFTRRSALKAMLGACGGAALALPGGAESAAPPAPGKLIVHEWGTFLSVQAPDGTALGGMIESEEELPNFVRERDLGGGNRACFNCKMETPVTYFYVDRPSTVEVRVGMPRGLLTHWFPAVRSFGPPLAARPSATPPGSFLDWGKVHLRPAPRGPAPGLRPVSATDPWRFVRDTGSALVTVGADRPRVRPSGDTEKFLFYRGLGGLDMPLEVTSREGRCSLSVSLCNRGREVLTGVFLIRVRDGSISLAPVADLDPPCKGRRPVPAELGIDRPLAQGVPQAKRQVADALVRAGLYRKEAEAMVNNWEKSYFRTEGVRVLYLLPRAAVDQTIPIRITPAPHELQRVMVGRVELLTSESKGRVEQALVRLGGRSPVAARQAEAELARLGRLREPVLRHIAATTKDASVRAQVEQRLKAVVAAKR
jgi:hypothetical protein